MTEIHNSINMVTGSLVLLSALGLWALTLSNRYTHVLTRIREFYEENAAKEELNFLIRRAQHLKRSFLALIVGGICSSVFLIGTALSVCEELLMIVMVVNLSCVFASMLFLFLEVVVSMRATLYHVKIKN